MSTRLARTLLPVLALLFLALPRPVVPQGSIFTLPGTANVWMGNPADFDGDGAQEIVLTTMDPGKDSQLTPPTQVFILSAENGVVTDRSPAWFGGNPPKSYSSKPFTGDFDGDGAMDLLICDRGRTAGPMPTWYWTPTDGVWAAQNQVFLNRDGVLRDYTSVYPQYFNQNWGCSTGDVDKSGRDSIVINSFFAVSGWTNAHLLKWDGSRFVKTVDLVRGAPSAVGWGWSATDDFNNDGFADIVGTSRILWGAAAVAPLTDFKPFATSEVQAAGYTFFRGSITGDLTGDGFPDLVKISSAPEPNFQGARFVLYESDGKGALVEKRDAFPALSAYRDFDFGNDVNIVDINFDGMPDIVPFGITKSAFYPDRPGEQNPPTAVWLNEGGGRFAVAQWSDSIQFTQNCGANQAYFLKTADTDVFNVVVSGCARRYATRRVTRATPLRLTK
jgi:hypothetical protein